MHAAWDAPNRMLCTSSNSSSLQRSSTAQSSLSTSAAACGGVCHSSAASLCARQRTHARRRRFSARGAAYGLRDRPWCSSDADAHPFTLARWSPVGGLWRGARPCAGRLLVVRTSLLSRPSTGAACNAAAPGMLLSSHCERACALTSAGTAAWTSSSPSHVTHACLFLFPICCTTKSTLVLTDRADKTSCGLLTLLRHRAHGLAAAPAHAPSSSHFTGKRTGCRAADRPAPAPPARPRRARRARRRAAA